MSKFIFVLSMFYCLVNGIKAWQSSFSFDFVSANAYSNTAVFCFVVMGISFIFMSKNYWRIT